AAAEPTPLSTPCPRHRPPAAPSASKSSQKTPPETTSPRSSGTPSGSALSDLSSAPRHRLKDSSNPGGRRRRPPGTVTEMSAECLGLAGRPPKQKAPLYPPGQAHVKSRACQGRLRWPATRRHKRAAFAAAAKRVTGPPQEG